MLSQKELHSIQSALKAEQLLYEKFGHYAHQATDPHLKELFHRVHQDEKRHHGALLEFLNQHGAGAQGAAMPGVTMPAGTTQ